MRDLSAQGRRTKDGPVRTEVVEGRPISVDGRELVPLVRVTRGARRQAQLRGDEVSAQGYGFVRMRPVAVVETDDSVEKRHAIHDETKRVMAWLMLVTALIPLLAALLIYVARRSRGEG